MENKGEVGLSDADKSWNEYLDMLCLDESVGVLDGGDMDVGSPFQDADFDGAPSLPVASIFAPRSGSDNSLFSPPRKRVAVAPGQSHPQIPGGVAGPSTGAGFLLENVSYKICREEVALGVPTKLCNLANLGDYEGIAVLVSEHFAVDALVKTPELSAATIGAKYIVKFFTGLMDQHPDMIFVHNRTIVDRTGNVTFKIRVNGTRIHDKVDALESNQNAVMFGEGLQPMVKMIMGGARRLFSSSSSEDKSKDKSKDKDRKDQKQLAVMDVDPQRTESNKPVQLESIECIIMGKFGFPKAGLKSDQGLITKVDIRIKAKE